MKALIYLVSLWLFIAHHGIANTHDGQSKPVVNEVKQVSALAYLKKMQTAYAQLNYKLLYVNSAQQPLQPQWFENTTFNNQRISYRNFINGPVREILQIDGRADYYEQGHYLYSLSGQREQSVFASVANFDLETGQDFYEYILLGKDRVADREAITVRMQSRDQYRYSYLLWLDSESFLPLRLDIIDQNNELLAQVLVVTLQLQDATNQKLVELSQQQIPNVAPETSSKELEAVRWQVDWLPDGFKMIKGDQHKLVQHDTDPVSYIMLSDGMVSISVYISSKQTINEDQRSVIHRAGTLLYTMQQGNIEVTIIGEVPLLTAEKIAASIKAIE